MGSLAVVLGGTTCSAFGLPSFYNPPSIGSSKKNIDWRVKFLSSGFKNFGEEKKIQKMKPKKRIFVVFSAVRLWFIWLTVAVMSVRTSPVNFFDLKVKLRQDIVNDPNHRTTGDLLFDVFEL